MHATLLSEARILGCMMKSSKALYNLLFINGISICLNILTILCISIIWHSIKSWWKVVRVVAILLKSWKTKREKVKFWILKCSQTSGEKGFRICVRNSHYGKKCSKIETSYMTNLHMQWFLHLKCLSLHSRCPKKWTNIITKYNLLG